MRWIISCAFVFLLGGGVLALFYRPNDGDHAAATTRDVVMAMSDPAGSGDLDSLRYDTTMGIAGKPLEIVDYLKFSDGLFMSRECTDRCNYPPSAYLTREVSDGTDFLIEAYCPTKNATMVWRGQVRGDDVSGTVTRTSARWYWKATQVLEFRGSLSNPPAEDLSAG